MLSDICCVRVKTWIFASEFSGAEVWSCIKTKYSSKVQVPVNYTEENVLSYFPPL